MSEWAIAGRQIEIIRNGKPDRRGDFDFEITRGYDDEIDNLIVGTKTHATVSALEPIKHRLGPNSNLLFVQNGIGVIDEVVTEVFGDASARPNMYAGILNHGVFRTGQFSASHIGLADMVLGPVMQYLKPGQAESISENMPFLLSQIQSCPPLNATIVSEQEIFYTQLRKLVINAVLNPLTAIFDCYNGEIRNSEDRAAIIDALVAEISTVVQAIVASTGDESAKKRFTAETLGAVVKDITAKTAGNISSMRQDALAKRKTEIDYINGYIVAQANRLGLSCPLNTKIVELVKQSRTLADPNIRSTFGL